MWRSTARAGAGHQLTDELVPGYTGLMKTYEATVTRWTADGEETETYTNLAEGDVEMLREVTRGLTEQGDSLQVSVRES